MLFFFNKINEELLTANSYLQNCLPCQRNILSWEIKTHTTNQQNATNSPYSFCIGMRLRLVWCFQTSLMKTCWNLQVAANRMLFSFPGLCFSHCFLCIQTGNYGIVWSVNNNSERSMTLREEKLQYLTNSQFSFKILVYCSSGSWAGFSTSSYFLLLSCNFGAGHTEYPSPFLSYSSHVFQKVLPWRPACFDTPRGQNSKCQ